MVRKVVVGILVTTLTASCVATTRESRRAIGPTADRCVALDLECVSDHECCSDRCVAQSCALAGGGT